MFDYDNLWLKLINSIEIDGMIVTLKIIKMTLVFFIIVIYDLTEKYMMNCLKKFYDLKTLSEP